MDWILWTPLLYHDNLMYNVKSLKISLSVLTPKKCSKCLSDEFEETHHGRIINLLPLLPFGNHKVSHKTTFALSSKLVEKLLEIFFSKLLSIGRLRFRAGCILPFSTRSLFPGTNGTNARLFSERMSPSHTTHSTVDLKTARPP